MAVSQHCDCDVRRHRPGRDVDVENDETHYKCDDDDSHDDKHFVGDGDDSGFGSRELKSIRFFT